jgi:hypothetical protein
MNVEVSRRTMEQPADLRTVELFTTEELTIEIRRARPKVRSGDFTNHKAAFRTSWIKQAGRETHKKLEWLARHVDKEF